MVRQGSIRACCGQCCTSFGGVVSKFGWLELVDSKDRAWRPCFTRHDGVSGHTGVPSDQTDFNEKATCSAFRICRRPAARGGRMT